MVPIGLNLSGAQGQQRRVGGLHKRCCSSGVTAVAPCVRERCRDALERLAMWPRHLGRVRLRLGWVSLVFQGRLSDASLSEGHHERGRASLQIRNNLCLGLGLQK